MIKPNLDEMAQALNKAGIPPRMDEIQSRVFIEILRLLAKGKPVTVEKTIAAVTRQGTPVENVEEAVSLIQNVSETDINNNIVGIFGLSLKSHPYKFQVGGQTLSAWCAWDTLFLPPLLGKTALVESSCPSTTDKIQLILSPGGVKKLKPKSAVLSMVIPKPIEDTTNRAAAIRTLFCGFVRFFSSARAAAEWFHDKNHDPAILSVGEGYQLGLIAWREVHKYA